MQTYIFRLAASVEGWKGGSVLMAIGRVLRAGVESLGAYDPQVLDGFEAFEIADMETATQQVPCVDIKLVRNGGKLARLAICTVSEKTPTNPGPDKK